MDRRRQWLQGQWDGVQVALERRELVQLETSGEGGAAAGPAPNQAQVLERW